MFRKNTIGTAYTAKVLLGVCKIVAIEYGYGYGYECECKDC